MALVRMADAHQCVSAFLQSVGLKPRTRLTAKGYEVRLSENMANRELDALGKAQPESWPRKLP